jgi:hypothetical protein
VSRDIADEQYRERVDALKIASGPDKTILALFNDAGLKRLDKKLLARCRAVGSMSIDDLRDPAKFSMYKAAHHAFSQSTRGKLIVFFHGLPLYRQYKLAKKNPEIERLFAENLRLKDKDCSPSPKVVSTNGNKTESLPYPLIAILKRSTKGGGKLGKQKLANELNQYCLKQLTDFHKNPLSFGLVNTAGILLQLFTPTKADSLIKTVLTDLEHFTGKNRSYSIVSIDDIKNFLKKCHVTQALDILNASK